MELRADDLQADGELGVLAQRDGRLMPPLPAMLMLMV